MSIESLESQKKSLEQKLKAAEQKVEAARKEEERIQKRINDLEKERSRHADQRLAAEEEANSIRADITAVDRQIEQAKADATNK